MGVTLGQLDSTELGLDDELELELALAIDEKDDDRVLERDEVGVELGIDDGMLVGNIIVTTLGTRLGSE